MKATIYDVAKLANTSIATVSYVLNNSRRVSKATAERVRRAIEELNYQP
ncbi:MAG: LacI family DNA-binding transcriptional regulator, partial [Anaerolineales bacterium]